jgi:hypothetical protein
MSSAQSYKLQISQRLIYLNQTDRIMMTIGYSWATKNVAHLGKKTIGILTHTFQILLPAIALHGAFDFVLMFIGAIQFVYQIEGIGLEIASFVIALAITIGGAFYAYYSFNKVYFWIVSNLIFYLGSREFLKRLANI